MQRTALLVIISRYSFLTQEGEELEDFTFYNLLKVCESVQMIEHLSVTKDMPHLLECHQMNRLLAPLPSVENVSLEPCMAII